MDQSIFVRPPKLDPAVWRPEVPLLVIVRCTAPAADGERRSANPASLILTWLAFRWFTAAYPKQRKFSSRRIAEWMGAKPHSVLTWSHALAELELLRYEGVETDNTFKRPQPVYSIPLRELEAESSRISLEMVLKWQAGPGELENHPDAQLPLDLAQQDAEENPQHVPKRAHAHVTNSAHAHVTNSAHAHVTNSAHAHVTNSAHAMCLNGHSGMDGSQDGWMDGGAPPAPPLKRSRGRPAKVPSVPPPELYTAHPGWVGATPLAAHPRELWRNACPTPTPAHFDRLTALAAEHDPPTGGHGWYWVGRAIVAGVDAEGQIRQPTYVRNTMLRWRDEDRYGSDRERRPAPPRTEVPNGRRSDDRPPRPVAQPRRPAPAPPAGAGPPAGLKLARVTPPTPPEPDGEQSA